MCSTEVLEQVKPAERNGHSPAPVLTRVPAPLTPVCDGEAKPAAGGGGRRPDASPGHFLTRSMRPGESHEAI
jgi:hypothetical protein